MPSLIILSFPFSYLQQLVVALAPPATHRRVAAPPLAPPSSLRIKGGSLVRMVRTMLGHGGSCMAVALSRRPGTTTGPADQER